MRRIYQVRSLALAAILGLVAANAVQAQIASAVRGGSSGNDPIEIAAEALGEDVLTFVDRTHEYNDVPGVLAGAQYVRVANNDKTVGDYSLEVTIDQDALVYLLIDRRVGDDNADDPPTIDADTMPFVAEYGFRDTGLTIGIDESGDGDIEGYDSVYVLRVPGGSTLVLGAQNDGGGRNMYGVAATPASASEAVPAATHVGLIALLVALLGAGGLLLRRQLNAVRV